MRALETWMEHEYRLAATFLTRCVSASGLVKVRSGFGQKIMPKKGSVIAALQIASYDPDPDYFFHWLRDSSLVMDALCILISDGTLGRDALTLFADFLRFSLDLRTLSGPELLRQGDVQSGVAPEFLRYVRSNAELGTVRGDRVLGEARFNPDGTLDTILWPRPQHDGPALRALTVMRFASLADALDLGSRAAMQDLALADLDFVERHWHEPSFDIWEEELGEHYYTRLVQFAALGNGATWAASLGEKERAHRYGETAVLVEHSLDRHWSSHDKFYRSRLSAPTGDDEKRLDFAVILAVLHCALKSGPHSILDPRTQATLARLEDLFRQEYTINRGRLQAWAPAMGRYKKDRYFSGGAYYMATLGAAEFHYRLARAVLDGTATQRTDWNRRFVRHLSAGDDNALGTALFRRGDAFMATVRHFTPPSGELSEQFDQKTGIQTSGKNLAWSYAAFVTAYAARKAAANPMFSSATAE